MDRSASMLERKALRVPQGQAIAVWILHKAAKNLPEAPDENTVSNPMAISLRPEQWEADGLFSGEGLSLVPALELLPGIEEMNLEARGAAVAGAAPASTRGVTS